MQRGGLEMAEINSILITLEISNKVRNYGPNNFV